MKCSECNGPVHENGEMYICTKCNRSVNKQEEIIDMSNLSKLEVLYD